MGTFRSSVEQALDHAASIAVGVVLVVVGLLLTYSLVLAIPGVIMLVAGAALVIAGLVRHSSRRARIKQS